MRLPIVLGPTAVGKTELSVKVAWELGAEIVSADSRQVYRFMDIGTAKPGRDELRLVKHHMIDIVDPDEHFGAGQYGTLAGRMVARLADQGVNPIVVGGSGLYIRALVEGLFPAPAVDESLRREILRQAKEKGAGFLYRRLEEVDPDSALRIHPNDLQRISRALEVYEQTGTPISHLQKRGTKTDFEPLYVGLKRDREELFERIESRADWMVASGFLVEVQNLLEKGYSPNSNSFRAVGYRELADHISGRISLYEAVATVKKNTKAFARRQLTWFGNLDGVKWFDLSSPGESEVPDRVSSFLAEHIERE